ncbi:sulfotransferase 1B1-like [Glandiceps talaboti]
MVDAETIKHSGFRFSLDKIKNFEVRSDDIYIITFMKSGTTWLKEILPLVLNCGDIQAFKDVPVDVKVPYLEFVLSADDDKTTLDVQHKLGVPEGFNVTNMQSPRILNSHLRQEFLPKELEEKKPKVIYCARNPKDVAVSAYWFTQMLLNQDEFGQSLGNTPYTNFGEFLPDFLETRGRLQPLIFSDDGSRWQEHVLSWWKKRHEQNILFLKYEDMVEDLKSSIRQIAKFLDAQLTDDAVERIATHCNIRNMKKNKMATKSDFCINFVKVDPEKNSPFVRKGGVGGWKEYFTVTSNEQFDDIYRSWLGENDLEMRFEL